MTRLGRIARWGASAISIAALGFALSAAASGPVPDRALRETLFRRLQLSPNDVQLDVLGGEYRGSPEDLADRVEPLDGTGIEVIGLGQGARDRSVRFVLAWPDTYHDDGSLIPAGARRCDRDASLEFELAPGESCVFQIYSVIAQVSLAPLERGRVELRISGYHALAR